MYEDKNLTCQDCNSSFVFSADDQQYHAQKGYSNEPKRCPSCRQSRRSDSGGGGGVGPAAPRPPRPKKKGGPGKAPPLFRYAPNPPYVCVPISAHGSVWDTGRLAT